MGPRDWGGLRSARAEDTVAGRGPAPRPPLARVRTRPRTTCTSAATTHGSGAVLHKCQAARLWRCSAVALCRPRGSGGGLGGCAPGSRGFCGSAELAAPPSLVAPSSAHARGDSACSRERTPQPPPRRITARQAGDGGRRGAPRYHAAPAAATATHTRRSAPHGLRADPLRGARPHRHRHPQPPRQAQRLDRRMGREVRAGDGRGRARRGGARDRADRRRPRLLRRRRHAELSGIVDAGGAARVERRAARPSRGDAAVRPDFRGPYAYFPGCPSRSSRRSTAPPPAWAWSSRSTATCASPPTPPGSPPPSRGAASSPSTGSPGCCRAWSASQHALDLLLSARMFTAQEALAHGPGHRVHPGRRRSMDGVARLRERAGRPRVARARCG